MAVETLPQRHGISITGVGDRNPSGPLTVTPLLVRWIKARVSANQPYGLAMRERRKS
jgi:hypothetical protein